MAHAGDPVNEWYGEQTQLNDALAHQIVSRAMKILSFSVNVMDERGLIIASGNPERLHQRHEGPCWP